MDIRSQFLDKSIQEIEKVGLNYGGVVDRDQDILSRVFQEFCVGK